ncbi:MAG: hypothetical protein ACYDCJ_05000 [Gammaproteobacteria bacterium]
MNGDLLSNHRGPLHSALAGRKYGRVHGNMRVTDKISETLVRLPMWVGLEDRDVDVIADLIIETSVQ